jgi:hypothetical protein
MKTLNAKLVLSALGFVAMLSSPGLAQTGHRQPSQTMQYQDPVEQYPIEGARTGSESNQSEQNSGYYTGS